MSATDLTKAGQPAKCLDCHKDVEGGRTGKRAFHGRSPLVARKECKTCHVEHEGRNAILVILDEKKFDHRFTDMPLLGAHARVTCAMSPEGRETRERHGLRHLPQDG